MFSVLSHSDRRAKLNPAPYVRILQLIDNKYPETERGDVLIFMSGIKEITTIVDACKEYAEKNQVSDALSSYSGKLVQSVTTYALQSHSIQNGQLL